MVEKPGAEGGATTVDTNPGAGAGGSGGISGSGGKTVTKRENLEGGITRDTYSDGSTVDWYPAGAEGGILSRHTSLDGTVTDNYADNSSTQMSGDEIYHFGSDGVKMTAAEAHEKGIDSLAMRSMKFQDAN
jgi:hypothetical protein